MYLDSSHELPGMLELIEYTPEQERTYTRMYTAALTWDGTDPVRFENR
jgi:hypothetical protein